MKALLVVTMLGFSEPGPTITTEFSSFEACAEARLKVMSQIIGNSDPIMLEKKAFGELSEQHYFDEDPERVQVLCVPKEDPPKKDRAKQRKMQTLFLGFITKLMELQNDNRENSNTEAALPSTQERNTTSN